MNKERGFEVFLYFLIICVLAVCIIILFSGNLSYPSIKRYNERPELNPAPKPLTDQHVRHSETSSVCGGDHISNRYFVLEPATEVEAYYQQEMEEYCLSRQGRQVTFSTGSCFRSAEIGFQECRRSACVLRDEAPSLYETFSVEIFQVSQKESFVAQDHGIHYLRKPPSNIQCGE